MLAARRVPGAAALQATPEPLSNTIYLPLLSPGQVQSPAPTATGTASATVTTTATATGTPAAETPSATATLQPTPMCSDDDDATPPQTEGPYFKPNSPERTSLLEAGISGTSLVLTGYVLTTSCQVVAGALLDFWHADDGGNYDNVGFKLRGHQFTDQAGRFTLETIVAGLYPGRTRHIHVKVRAPNQPILTTQLYFPGEPRNASDGLYNPALLMDVQDAGSNGKTATFNFVLQIQ
ncbi:MAG: hypothetical protein HY326_06145 [Chloroflexi bacterium]|nr:hypothetical protein [Chloroflexota bacterium]